MSLKINNINNINTEKKSSKKNEKLFKIYEIARYTNCTKKFIEEKGKEYTLKEVVKILTKINKGYHEKLNKDDYYIFYGDIDQYKGTLENFFDLLIKFMENFYNLKINKDDISYTKSKSKEGSYHFTIPKYHTRAQKLKEIFNNFFQNHLDQFLYKSETRSKDQKVIDTSFYMNGWFRYPNQHKEGVKDSEHIIKKGKMEDFILTNIPKESVCIDEYHFLINTCQENNNKKSELNHNITINLDKREIEILKRLFDECYKQIRFDNYEYWVNVGMAIKNKYGDLGFELFEYYSNKSGIADNKSKLLKKYDSFEKGLDKSITIRTIYYYAKEDNINKFYEIIKEYSVPKFYYKKYCKVQGLINLLNISRLDDENNWMDIGKCLYNIDINLLEIWKQLSLKNNKYLDKDIDKIWSDMRKNEFNINTLHFWAKCDNYDEYMKLNNNNIIII